MRKAIFIAIFLVGAAVPAIAYDCPDGPGTPTCRDLYNYWNRDARNPLERAPGDTHDYGTDTSRSDPHTYVTSPSWR